jgi:hypothetical protein
MLFRGLEIDSGVYSKRLLVFDHNTLSSSLQSGTPLSDPGSSWHCLTRKWSEQEKKEGLALALRVVWQYGSRTVLGLTYLLFSISLSL